MTFAKPEAQVERDRWGRPLVIPAGGGKTKAYRRCTKFIDVLDDRYRLELWKQRQVADGLARRPDLVLKAAAANGDKEELNDVSKQALEAAGSSTSATTGSAVHSLTEQLDRGEDPLIPPPTQPDIDAYRSTTEHLAMRMIEIFVVHDELHVGGTFDRIVELSDGTLVVADIKTGSIDYGASKIAMQLATYSRSQLYDPSTGRRRELEVDQHRGLVIHLPAGAGECSLHWADLDAGWEGVKVAQQIWEWRKRQGLLEASSPEDTPDLLGLIGLAGDEPSLRRLWAAHQSMWTETHTAAVKERLAELHKEKEGAAA